MKPITLDVVPPSKLDNVFPDFFLAASSSSSSASESDESDASASNPNFFKSEILSLFPSRSDSYTVLSKWFLVMTMPTSAAMTLRSISASM